MSEEKDDRPFSKMTFEEVATRLGTAIGKTHTRLGVSTAQSDGALGEAIKIIVTAYQAELRK